MGQGMQQHTISLVVRIAAFQAVDPGSNPGWRIILLFLKWLIENKNYAKYTQTQQSLTNHPN